MSLSNKRNLEDANIDGPPSKRRKKNHSYYDIFGDDCRVEVEVRQDEMKKRRNRKSLHGQDFQTLILWMLGEVMSPKWVFIKHRPLIEKVVVVQIEDLTEDVIKSLRSFPVKETEKNNKTNTNTSTSNGHESNTPDVDPTSITSDTTVSTDSTAAVANVNAKTPIAPFAFFSKHHYCPLQLDIPKFERKSKSKYPSFKKLTVVAVDRIRGLSSNKNLPFGKKQKRRKSKQSQHGSNGLSNLTTTFGDEYKFSPELFLCSEVELRGNGYPFPNDPNHLNYTNFFRLPDSSQSTQSRITTNHTEATQEIDESECSDVSAVSGSTIDASSVGSKSIEKLVALDCEMVHTTKGIELARVSITSEAGECIYDELVKPPNNILDYCTRYFAHIPFTGFFQR